MRKTIRNGLAVCVVFLLFVLAGGSASAKDKESGVRMKIKNAEVVKMMPEIGVIVVKKGDAVYNLDLTRSDPDKAELLSKYGINVDVWDLIPGDHITFVGRKFADYFVPSKARVEKDSQKKLYKDKKGVMVADVYATDNDAKIIYAAHSLNKTDATAVAAGDEKVTEKGEPRKFSSLKTFWRLSMKGVWDNSEKVFKKLEYIRIKAKHDNEAKYQY